MHVYKMKQIEGMLMTSKLFSKAKNIRAKTKSVQSCIRYIKKSRLRHFRRISKQQMKFTHSDDTLHRFKLVNDGNRKIA